MLASKLFDILEAVYPTSTANSDETASRDYYSDDDTTVDGLLMAEEAIFASSSSSSQDPRTSSSSPPVFQVRPVPGKGLGLVATSPIPACTLILSEAPLIALTESELGYYRIEWEINKLTEPDRAAYYQMHHTGMDELPSILEIWRKNSFGLGNIAHQQGIFKIISKINSSCTPNCAIAWNEDLARMNVYATRAIGQGEEIQVCYVSTLLPRGTRNELFYDQWEFSCRCKEVCGNLNAKQVMKSDERRKRVSWIVREELDYGSGDLQRAFNVVKEGLQLLEEENLPNERLSLSWVAYQLATLHNKTEEAKYYASLAYEHSKLLTGEDHHATILARKGMVEPTFYKSQLNARGGSGGMLSECVIS